MYDEGFSKFEWAQLPQSLGAFALVAVVLLLIWYVVRTYRREIDTCPPRIKMLLAGLRIAVILLLVLIFLSPQLVPLMEKTVQRTTQRTCPGVSLQPNSK